MLQGSRDVFGAYLLLLEQDECEGYFPDIFLLQKVAHGEELQTADEKKAEKVTNFNGRYNHQTNKKKQIEMIHNASEIVDKAYLK